MDNKCILVTGSSSGIGRSIAIKLLESGARVIGLARDHSKFKLKNKNYLTYNVDLNDFDSLKKIMIKNSKLKCFYKSMMNLSLNALKMIKNIHKK